MQQIPTVANRMSFQNMRTHEDHLNAEGGHDSTYDHEAFLGKDAAEFDQLTPEQSKKRLRWDDCLFSVFIARVTLKLLFHKGFQPVF